MLCVQLHDDMTSVLQAVVAKVNDQSDINRGIQSDIKQTCNPNPYPYPDPDPDPDPNPNPDPDPYANLNRYTQ